MGSRNLIAETSFIERRLKYVVIVLSTIFVLNILAFIFLEGLNLLDAIYFTIITITTVGYGDITPENPVTKILLILLLITTLTIVATISEFVIDRVVARRESRLYLPAGGVGWKKHAIIADITPLSLDIARTLQTRFIDVLLLDQDSEKVIGARNQGYNAFIGDIAEEENVHKLNLEEADVIFLFRSTNESLLKTTIILRAESESIPIYALTPEHELEQEFAQQVGISRVYSYPRLIASTISLMTRDIKVAVFANQPERDANYYYAIVRPSSFANVQQYLGDHLVLGVFNFTTLSFYNHLSPEFTDHVNSIDTPESDEYGFLTVFPKTNADNLK
ncbi:MAG: ion channel, partial [Candidatus Kariarchaeaceae archaeon]